MTTGDAINSALAQDLNSLNGKILRLNPDGTVPADNPFGTYVWTYGHRNPQGLVWYNNILYSSEHGPTTNDELNIIEKGRNYGWVFVEGYCSDNNISGELNYCTANNIKEALKAFTPIEAPSGIDYYSSHVINQWTNSILIASLRGQKLIQLKIDNTGKQVLYQKSYFFQEFGRLRDICISPAGKVYICVDSDFAKIIEISNDVN
jgi:aldose sugar dehydrogenase